MNAAAGDAPDIAGRGNSALATVLKSRGLMALGILVVLSVLSRAATFNNPVIGFDEQFYLLVGNRMLDGAVPYVDIWDRKPIGLFLIYMASSAIGNVGIFSMVLLLVRVADRAGALLYTYLNMRVTRSITIDESELNERFILASGPGGQNVNKVATAVELRFDVLRSPGLPEAVRERLVALAGKRMSAAGVLVIAAQRFRSQARNREDARERLAALIRAAATPPKLRRATRPTRAAKRRRLEDKRLQGTRKRERSGTGWE